VNKKDADTELVDSSIKFREASIGDATNLDIDNFR
jgi:hypothetical protein